MAGDERVVGDLRIGIDATLCVAFADCVTAAPEAFRVDDDAGLVEFVDPGAVDRERLIEACAACPVDALLVWDGSGKQVVPRVRE
jgi:ferredoxin